MSILCHAAAMEPHVILNLTQKKGECCKKEKYTQLESVGHDLLECNFNSKNVVLNRNY